MIANERAVIANSLWTATANPAPDFGPPDGDLTADIAVIGGGYTGLSAALHAAETGARVVLLEAEQPGWGASGRNGGQINPGLKDGPDMILARLGPDRGARMIAMAGEAADLVFDLIARHDIACDAVRPGWIRAAHTPRALADLHTLAREWQRQGAPVEPLDGAEIARLTGTNAYLGGLIDRRGGNLHPLNYALGLACAARRAGATIHGHAPVTGITAQAGGHAVHTTTGRIIAGRVIVATNAYTTPALGRALARSIVPVRSVQVATVPLSDNLRRSLLAERHAVSDTRRLLLYFRVDSAGRFIIGGRGTFRDASTRRQMAWLRRRAVDLFPQLGCVDWQHAWGGVVALTADHLPHLHEPAPGVLAGLGYNGRGVALATAMGRVLAHRACGAAPETLDFPVTPVRALPPGLARGPLIEVEILRQRLLDRLGL